VSCDKTAERLSKVFVLHSKLLDDTDRRTDGRTDATDAPSGRTPDEKRKNRKNVNE